MGPTLCALTALLPLGLGMQGTQEPRDPAPAAVQEGAPATPGSQLPGSKLPGSKLDESRQAKPEAGLRRVAPEGDQGRSLKRLFARDFDRADWEERLRAADLDQREKDLDGLLKRACFDPVARAFLEDLARDEKGGELSWTARLGLRELGRARFPMKLTPSDPLSEPMERMLNEWMARDGMGFLLPPSSLPLARPQAGSTRRSVHIEQSKTGARVAVTANEDGKDVTRTYEGKSLDEILEQNPDLQRDIGHISLHIGVGTPLNLGFELSGVPDAGGSGSGRRLGPEQLAQPVRTDKLGVLVQKVTPQQARDLGLSGQGLYVQHSFPETLAFVLGVGSGDVLVELDGVALCEVEDIEKGLKARGATDPYTLVWIDELGQRHKKSWSPGH